MKKTLLVLASLLFLIPSVSSASTLTQAQVDAIIGVLQAFGADIGVIQSVEVDLAPSAPETSITDTPPQVVYGSPTAIGGSDTTPIVTQAPVVTPAPIVPSVLSIQKNANVGDQNVNAASTGVEIGSFILNTTGPGTFDLLDFVLNVPNGSLLRNLRFLSQGKMIGGVTGYPQNGENDMTLSDGYPIYGSFPVDVYADIAPNVQGDIQSQVIVNASDMQTGDIVKVQTLLQDNVIQNLTADAQSCIGQKELDLQSQFPSMDMSLVTSEAIAACGN
jgi:hypothetical protein